MNKLIILIISLIISSCQGFIGNLFSITTQGNDASNLNLLVVDQSTLKIVLEKSIALPSGLSMQAITGINFEAGVITLLGISSKKNSQTPQTFNLIDYNLKSGEQVQSYGKSFVAPSSLNFGNGGSNYIISSNEHIYFVNPLDYSEGIKLVDLYFENYNTSNIPSNVNEPSKEFLIQDTTDIDETFAPISAISVEDGNLVVAYHSNEDPETVATIVICNLNGTDSSSGSSSSSLNLLNPIQSYKIKLGDDISVNLVSKLYTDHIGGIYLVLNQTDVCKVDPQTNYCDIVHNAQPFEFSPNFSFNPFIVTQDKSYILSFSTLVNNNKNDVQLYYWGFNFNYGYTILIQNYWLAKNLPQSFTYFAV